MRNDKTNNGSVAGAGIIAGLCAQGADPVQAAVWGVFLHGQAGDVLECRVGKLGYLARELAVEIPRLIDASGARRLARR